MNGFIKLSSPATGEFWQIPVLFEDDHLLVLDKPTGLLTSPDRSDPQRPCLMNLLHFGIATSKPWVRERALKYLMNAYRLDSETGGVMLLAKDKRVLVALANLFGSGKPFKQYVAIVCGSPTEKRFAVDAKLASHPVKTGVMRVDSKRGKKSETRFEELEKFSGYTLLNAEPLPDRPHQIRVHLRHFGLPVVGDVIYGGRPLRLSSLKSDYRLKEGKVEHPLISRAATHLERLTFPHPVTNEFLTISSPWPKDLKVAVKYLRQFVL